MTFEQARERVAQSTEADWRGPGTHYVAPDGFEDARGYLVTVGPREWLRDRDPDFAVLGDPQFIVDKSTGAVEEVVYITDAERLDAMTPVPTT